MDLKLPNRIATRIKKHVRAKTGETPLEVVEKALDHLDEETKTNTHDTAVCFSEFRGMAKGWTLDQMLVDRREGLM